jgi:hypothetical protein
MKTKGQKYQFRMDPLEYIALMRLAQKDGIKMSQYLRNHIRAEAQKKGIPL